MKVAYLFLIIGALCLAVMITGCSQESKMGFYEQINVGQTSDEVRKVLWEPDAQNQKYWVYVEPFYLAVVPFDGERVAEKVRFTDHQVDYSAREYHD